MGRFNWRDLARGILLGLIAGLGYLIAYLIVLMFALDTPYYQQMQSLGWLLTIPVPAALLYFLSKRMQPDAPIKPIEPVEVNADDAPAQQPEQLED